MKNTAAGLLAAMQASADPTMCPHGVCLDCIISHLCRIINCQIIPYPLISLPKAMLLSNHLGLRRTNGLRLVKAKRRTRSENELLAWALLAASVGALIQYTEPMFLSLLCQDCLPRWACTAISERQYFT